MKLHRDLKCANVFLGSKGEAQAHQPRYRVDFRSKKPKSPFGPTHSNEGEFEEVNTSTKTSCGVRRQEKVREAKGPCVVCIQIGATKDTLRHTDILRQILMELKIAFGMGSFFQQAELPPDTAAAACGLIPPPGAAAAAAPPPPDAAAAAAFAASGCFFSCRRCLHTGSRS